MIEIKNIHKSFGSLEVLKGIDLTINKGEVVSIVGPSGEGKTTLLQIMGTLDKATQGSITIANTAVHTLSDSKLSAFRNKHIGFVFQFHQLLPEFSAIENIMIPAFIAGVSKKEAKQRAQELLAFMGLEDRANHKPNELSGGEKQRVGILRAIIANPKILLMDEPFSALDPISKVQLQDLIKQLHDEYKRTTVFVTHDMDEAMKLADRICVLKNGKVVQIATPEVLKENPADDFVREFFARGDK